MTLRRATQAQPAHNPPLARASRAKKLENLSSSHNQRPALVTIQQNIRRNKSRQGFVPDDAVPELKVSAGTKRKRANIGNENALVGPSHPRSAKRLKRSPSPAQSSTNGDDEVMDSEDGSETDEEDEAEYYLLEAPRSELLKLRKEELTALYKEANIARPVSDVDQLTRQLIANAIISARTNRPRRGVSKRALNGLGQRQRRSPTMARAPVTPDSDDYRMRGLGSGSNRTPMRRAVTDVEAHGKTLLPLARSFSLNAFRKQNTRREKQQKINSSSSTMSDEPPPVTPISPPITRKRVQSDPRHARFPYDELSEVSEADEFLSSHEPSPRRLRSHGEGSLQRVGRKLPRRTAKPKAGELQEDDSDEFVSGGSDEDGVPASSTVDTDRDEDVGGDDDGEEEEDDDDDDEEDEDEDRASPRKLRNGKVLRRKSHRGIGEEKPESDSSTEEAEGAGETDYMDEDEASQGEEEEDNPEDDDYSDDVDLSEETVKSLTRYRREELVRLCESRNLDVDGTKPQLAKALLEWRDSRQASSSSGASTVRAPSTEHPKRHKARPPVLERKNRVHVSQPQTPPLSDEHGIESVEGVVVNHNAEEPELEFDLGSLGLEDREIPFDKLVKKEKIGSGGFKDVYSGTLKGRKVAIAEFRGHLTAMDIKELQVLRDLVHPNIVKFHGVSVPENTKETPVVMVSELCTNGDLFDYIRNEPAPPLKIVLRLMYDIASGLEYLHLRKPSIIHRDCKSSNILITGTKRAKIADFGLAKVKQSTRSMVRSLVGTVNWQAPELWHARPKYDHKVDVFSCAMVFWEILQWHLPNKKYPWEGMNEHAIYDAVGSRRHRPSLAGLRKQWCPELVDLVERMWAQDPRERPTMSEVVQELDNMRS
ncbi:hypothetical protein FRC14_001836 [Serendipita sp. 396]|nr:hypothetical protein FRC14_001836 [Serendipita sp. 396]KAG8803835.1 hypothetical protein FRC16_002692 [Serendipita sp. 398]KAG8875854.1 hypothetical protein FRC20_002884 [Serendipita sp. 405]